MRYNEIKKYKLMAKITLEKLAQMVGNGFNDTVERFKRVDDKFAQVNSQLKEVDKKLYEMDTDIRDIKAELSEIKSDIIQIKENTTPPNLQPTTYLPATPERSDGGRDNLQPKKWFTSLNSTKREFRQKRNYLTGFTIIELLVVVGIIGIVTGIIMSSISSAKAKGRDAKRIADVSVIQLALERYYDINRNYPTSLSSLADSSVPTKDPSGNNYSYVALECSVSIPYSYHLGTTLELGNSILNDDMDQDFNSTSASSCGGTGFNGLDSKSYDVRPKF